MRTKSTLFPLGCSGGVRGWSVTLECASSQELLTPIGSAAVCCSSTVPPALSAVPDTPTLENTPGGFPHCVGPPVGTPPPRRRFLLSGYTQLRHIEQVVCLEECFTCWCLWWHGLFTLTAGQTYIMASTHIIVHPPTTMYTPLVSV